jgi:hypothetical protein
MRQRARSQSTDHLGRRATILSCATAAFAVPNTALAAQGAASDSYAWVWVTLVSVLIVAAVWLASGTAMRAFIRLRWLPRHKKVRLDRAINVFFGALLIMALVLPYLAVAAPTLALLCVGTFIVVSFGALMVRRPAANGDDIQLQE